MSDVFVGDNDHGDRVPSVGVLLQMIKQLRAERDEARRRTNSILTEIDCRIEHGAESNGHLEVLRDMFKENTDE